MEMFERLNTPEEAFKWQLGAALTMEREIVDMLDELIEEAEHDELKQAFRHHQSETRTHVTNLEQAFRTLGWEVDDSPCPTIKALEKEGKANIKKADDAIVDSVIAGGAMETEHHEIAVYENLLINARGFASEQLTNLLRANLADEQAALQKVTRFAEQQVTPHPAIGAV
jgi:ferritin-like metal-binding protein YciE